MSRSVSLVLLSACLAIANLPAAAQTTQRAGRKAVHQAKPVTAPPSSGGNINAPSTDFSKVERAGEDEERDSSGHLRPVMGAGGMGLGGAF